jgi:hypothetical protein
MDFVILRSSFKIFWKKNPFVFSFFIVSIQAFELGFLKVVNMSSYFARRKKKFITINFLNFNIGYTLHCKVHFSLDVNIFGVKVLELRR